MVDDIKATAKTMAERTEDFAQKSSDGAKDVAASANASAQTYAAQASDMAGDMYGKAASAVGGVADQLPGSAGDAMEAGKKVYRDSSATIAKQVSKQPIEALLLAGAIGYLVGWATNRS